MKPFMHFALLIVVAVPAFAGTTKHDPTMPKQKAPVTSPKEPKINGLPAHHGSTLPAAAHSPKSGSVDSQLNQLEKQNTKIAGLPATQPKKTAPASNALLKPARSEPGNKGIDFKHQPLKNNTSKNKSAKAPSKKGSSGHRVGH